MSGIARFPAIMLMAAYLILNTSGCQKVASGGADEILAVMQAAEDGWNRGDIEAYMDCYARSPQLRFAGRDEVRLGWEPVLKKYQASYPDQAAMGQLKFTELQVEMMGGDDALVFGRWLLRRAQDTPHGLFTLHFRRSDGRWKIISDHTSSGKEGSSPGVATITDADLLTKVEQLADPVYGGRLPGTEGYRKAAAHMARRFTDLGLQPGGDDGYFQHLPMELNRVLPGCRLAFEDADHSYVEAVLDKDYLFRGFTGAGQVTAPVVFCGYGISLPERGYDDYAGTDVSGKVVLIFKQNPPWRLDDQGWGNWGYPRARAQAALDHGAQAVLMVSRPLDKRPQPLIGSVMHGPGKQVDIPQLQISPRVAEELLGHIGMELAELQERIDENRQPYSRELSQAVQIQVETQYQREADTVNVVAVLPGSDPELSGEHLVIGAHLDHVGTQGGTAFFPGANDNASGSAAVVELAEAFVHGGIAPRRSLVFVLFAGEEQGLFGSRFYAENPALPLEDAVAMFNLDCVAHGDSIQIWGGKSAPELWNIARNIDAGGDQLLAQRTGRGGGADAAPFFDRGLPTLYFASKYSYTNLHRTSDTPATLNGAMYQSLARLAFATAQTVADGSYQREELVP